MKRKSPAILQLRYLQTLFHHFQLARFAPLKLSCLKEKVSLFSKKFCCHWHLFRLDFFNVWHLFKVNKKDTRITSDIVLVSFLITMSRFHILFWSGTNTGLELKDSVARFENYNFSYTRFRARKTVLGARPSTCETVSFKEQTCTLLIITWYGGRKFTKSVLKPLAGKHYRSMSVLCTAPSL